MAGQHTAGRQPGSIERVREMQLFVRAAVFYVAAAGLVSARIRGRADLFINAHAGNPDFNIIGFSHGERAVPGGQTAQAVVQAELLYQAFRLADQLCKGLAGAFPPS